jgi:predicted DNA-binding transcriptional regulator AlpA
MRAEDLMGFAEVADLLGVPKRTAARYAKRSDFPEPVRRLASGPIWVRRDVERWAKKNLPLTGGRPRNPSSSRE